MEPKGLLPGPRRVLLVGVRGDQGGVQVEHHPPVLDRCAGPRPHPLPGSGPRTGDRRQRVIGIPGQGRDQPRHRGIRGHQAEHPRLGAQHREIAGGVPTQRDRHRQIQHDLPRIMRRERFTPRSEQPRQLPRQPATAGGVYQQGRARVRHQRLAAGDHRQPGTQTPILHPRSASHSVRSWRQQPRSNPAEQALSRNYRVRVTRRSTSMKARG